MDDALRAYDVGRADGLAGLRDHIMATDPDMGADYRVGLTDGQLELFEKNLLAAVRNALGDAA
jgi:hypothetical protein